MIDKTEFEEIKDILEKSDSEREDIIQNSREIINLSKRTIYAVQREDMKSASKLLKLMESNIKKLRSINKNLDTNINKVAFQEYVEAICFYEFMKSGKLISYKKLEVSVEDYLMGICDLTGELVRKAVFDVINKKEKNAKQIKEFVSQIYLEFLKFTLRNGELRKKSDSIKWNLKKLEEIMYDLSIKSKK
tara:strand:- start:7903 stop:8472 length:570 start_codon:yes stop_codon:yes gene_type:complete